MDWINVNDRLPENLDEVLTYDKNEGIGISFFSNDSWYDYNTTKSLNPVYWMPLPEPPEEI